MEHPFLMFLDHTQRRTTVSRTPLDEWSARRRDLYPTTHDTHNRQISMPPVGFEPKISAGERQGRSSQVRVYGQLHIWPLYPRRKSPPVLHGWSEHLTEEKSLFRGRNRSKIPRLFNRHCAYYAIRPPNYCGSYASRNRMRRWDRVQLAY